MFQNAEKFNRIFELVVAILLGLTAVLTSYASWQAGLYGGNQATKYTRGTAVVGEANSMYIEALQELNRDMQVYDEINNLRIDLTIAYDQEDEAEIARLEWKLDEMMENNLSEELMEAIEWADSQEDYYSPFEMEGLVESYYHEANELYEEGYAMIEDGQQDNASGDKLNTTTVIYAVVLFLLGIVGTFQNNKIKFALGCVSVLALGYAFIMMLSIPMIPLT